MKRARREKTNKKQQGNIPQLNAPLKFKLSLNTETTMMSFDLIITTSIIE